MPQSRVSSVGSLESSSGDGGWLALFIKRLRLLDEKRLRSRRGENRVRFQGLGEGANRV
jgi:hypothetical protein